MGNWRSSSTPIITSLFFCLVLLGSAVSARADSTATYWQQVATGNWSDGSLWTNGVPNNGALVYTAIVNAAGATGYTVTLNSNASIDNLILNSSMATVYLPTGRTLDLTGPEHTEIRAGRLTLGGTVRGGQIDMLGGSLWLYDPNLYLTDPNARPSVTFNGTILNGNASTYYDLNLTGGAKILGSIICNYTGRLKLQQDTAMTGQTVQLISGGSPGSGIDIGDGYTLSLDSTAVLRSSSSDNQWGYGDNSNTVTGIDGLLVNQGLIMVDSVAYGSTIAKLTISSQFRNVGTVVVGDYGVLKLNGLLWSNEGRFVVNNGGTLWLDGAFPSDSIMGSSRLIRNGQTSIIISGMMDNTGRTLDLTTCGVLSLSNTTGGGVIKGGMITGGSGNVQMSYEGGTLDGVTILGDLVLTNTGNTARGVRLTGGSDFTGNLTLTGNTNARNWLKMDQDYTFTNKAVTIQNFSQLAIAPGRTVTLAESSTLTGYAGYIASTTAGDGSKFINQGRLLAPGIPSLSFYISPDRFENYGTIELPASGKLVIQPATWLNTGTVTMGSGSSLAIQPGIWANTGAIIIGSNSNLSLGGTFTLDDLNLPRWSRAANSTVKIIGNLILSDNVDLSWTGPISLGASGKIIGGNIFQDSVNKIIFTDSGTLDGVTLLNGDLVIPAQKSVTIVHGIQFPGDLLLAGYIGFSSDQTLSGKNIVLSGGGINIGKDTTLVLDDTVSGNSTFAISAGGKIVNKGTIQSTGITINTRPAGSLFVNDGTIEVPAGGSIQFYGPLAGTGQLINSGNVNFYASASPMVKTSQMIMDQWISVNGGLFTISGNIDNTGDIIDPHVPLVWDVGTIVGGQVNGTDIRLAGAYGGLMLNGVLWNGDLTFAVTTQCGTNLHLNNGARITGNLLLSGSSNVVYFDEDYVWDKTIDIDRRISQNYRIENNSINFSGYAFTIAPSGLVRGAGGMYSASILDNQGLISADRLGTLTITATTFTNSGTLESLSGAIMQISSRQFTNSGIAQARNGGALNINAQGWSNASDGVLSVLPGSTLTTSGTWSNSGRIIVDGGTATLSGTWSNHGRVDVISGTMYLNSDWSMEDGQVTGCGTIQHTAGKTIIDGGVISPGESIGTLTHKGALMLMENAMLSYELDTPNIVGGAFNDLLSVTGALTLDGTLDVTPLDGFGVGVYRLINYTGLLTDNGLDIGSMPRGYIGVIDCTTAGQVNLDVSVPEPTTLALLMLGGLSLLRRRSVWQLST